MKKLLLIIFVIITNTIFAQENEQKRRGFNFSIYKGYAVAGYVDDGGFINFTGPNINYTIEESTFTLGMLPSLRFKKDTSEPRNSFVTPNLGVGLTYAYRIWAIQLPLYYNAKTATENGQWNIGIGFGLRLDRLSKK